MSAFGIERVRRIGVGGVDKLRAQVFTNDVCYSLPSRSLAPPHNPQIGYRLYSYPLLITSKEWITC
jgi:hypothetical protein